MTLDQLKKICVNGGKRNDIFYPYLIKFLTKYEINTNARITAFLAQVIHESGSFRYVAEIASGMAYEGRKDLGNVKFGDGKRFKGRGLIQITGRSNYDQVSKALGIDFVNTPLLLEQTEYAVESACWWWKSHGLNELADTYEFDRITKRINGGYNGKKERDELYNLARKILK